MIKTKRRTAMIGSRMPQQNKGMAGRPGQAQHEGELYRCELFDDHLGSG